MYRRGKENAARQQHLEGICHELAQSLRDSGSEKPPVQQVLDDLVSREGVTGVLFRCQHGRETVAGDFDSTVPGTRLSMRNGRARKVKAQVLWRGRTSDPTSKETMALRTLFEAIASSCEASCALAPPALTERKAA
jgi:hypothetical protein